jgi:hypothetical protein
VEANPPAAIVCCKLTKCLLHILANGTRVIVQQIVMIDSCNERHIFQLDLCRHIVQRDQIGETMWLRLSFVFRNQSSRLRQLNEIAHFSQQISFETVTQILPQTLIDRILEDCSANEARTRKLPSVLTVWLVILMHLFSNIGL